MKRSLIAFTIACAQVVAAASPEDEIEAQARKIAATTKDNAIAFRSVRLTAKDPFVAYRVDFLVHAPELKSNDKAKPGNAEYYANSAKTMVWEKKFCNTEMLALAKKYRLMINGVLVDSRQNTHSISVCAFYNS